MNVRPEMQLQPDVPAHLQAAMPAVRGRLRCWQSAAGGNNYLVETFRA